jgi:hypothetical protein
MKYTVCITSTSIAYAEVEIEAEDPEDAHTRAWEMLDAGDVELTHEPGEIEVDVYEAEDDTLVFRSDL